MLIFCLVFVRYTLIEIWILRKNHFQFVCLCIQSSRHVEATVEHRHPFVTRWAVVVESPKPFDLLLVVNRPLWWSAFEFIQAAWIGCSCWVIPHIPIEVVVPGGEAARGVGVLGEPHFEPRPGRVSRQHGQSSLGRFRLR